MTLVGSDAKDRGWTGHQKKKKRNKRREEKVAIPKSNSRCQECDLCETDAKVCEQEDQPFSARNVPL